MTLLGYLGIVEQYGHYFHKYYIFIFSLLTSLQDNQHNVLYEPNVHRLEAYYQEAKSLPYQCLLYVRQNAECSRNC